MRPGPMLLLLLIMTFSATAESDWMAINPALIHSNMLVHSASLSSEYLTPLDGLTQLSPFAIQTREVSCASFMAGSAWLSAERRYRLSLQCESFPDEPVTALRMQEARAYCRSLGGDLPSEQQWMAAALSIDVRIPVNVKLADYVVDTQDAFGHGELKGMLGNVWEMTITPWRPRAAGYVMKGGAFDLSATPELLNPMLRAAYQPQERTNRNLGFRCVK